ncbi:MAG TPA: VWA domain-containing protein [Verrucomicrobiae bacterium]|nr:VWA domain-containing protein [Verrucomicrobiae bacterium]
MTGEFEFQFPWLLALLGLLPVYALLRGKVGKFSALTFSSADIARQAGARARSAPGRFLAFLRLLVVALGIVALAGPRLANYHVETETPGIDIMLVLDLSWSMMAIDMGKPEERMSRFAGASGVLKDFIAKRPNDRIGLIAFSGVPYLVSPLTLNHAWLDENIERLHIGIIGDLGTAIGDAVIVGAKRLKAVPNSKSRIMILLTDGDNNMGKIDPLPASQLAAALGVKIYTIGIGIEAPCNMPAFDPDTGQFKLDANGNIIPTLLLQPANYSVLDKMANLSGGRFYRATNHRELASIYDQINHLEKSEVKQRRFATYEPLFVWPLLAALGLLAVELILAETRFRRTP